MKRRTNNFFTLFRRVYQGGGLDIMRKKDIILMLSISIIIRSINITDLTEKG